MHARRALRCQLTDDSADAADEEALDLLNNEEAALEQEVLDLNKQLRKVKASPRHQVNSMEQGQSYDETPSETPRARSSSYAHIYQQGAHCAEEMDADFGVEQDEEDDEEEDLSREEFFTPSSMNMSVRTLGSRASSGKAGETPYFSAAATAAAYRAMSRSLVPDTDGEYDITAMDTTNEDRWTANSASHGNVDGMQLKEPPLAGGIGQGSRHGRSRSSRGSSGRNRDMEKAQEGGRGTSTRDGANEVSMPIELNPTPPCSPVRQCEESQLMAESFHMPESMTELTKHEAENAATEPGQQQNGAHAGGGEVHEAVEGHEQSTLLTSRSHYTADHSAMLSSRSYNTTDQSALLSSRSHHVAIPSSHVEWRPSSKSFIGMIRKNRVSSSGAEMFNSPERKSGAINVSKHAKQSLKRSTQKVDRFSPYIVEDPKPSIPVEIQYDAYQDARTQMRTSINYYSPSPSPPPMAEQQQREVVGTQQVIVMPRDMDVSARGGVFGGDEDMKGVISKETLAIMDESLVSKVMSDMAEIRAEGKGEEKGQAAALVGGAEGRACAVQEQLERVVSNVCSRVSCAEEVLLDQLRAKFEEAVDGLLSNMAWEGRSIRDMLGPDDIQRWITVAMRPSEATVRDRFQSLQRECVETLQTMNKCTGVDACRSAVPVPLSCSCALRAAALVPGCKVSEVQDPEETWLAVKAAVAELRHVSIANEAQQTSSLSALQVAEPPPPPSPSVELGLDIQRLDLLDGHVGQLQSILAVAVAELEMSASDSKMMEARTVAAQANAVSAEQRAKLAERERDELSEQLAMARQLINSRESVPTGRAAAGSPTSAEARAVRAEKTAAEATAKSEALQREMTILRLQTRIAVEQLRAFGSSVDGMAVDIGSQDGVSSQGSPVRGKAQSAASANSPGAASCASRSSHKSTIKKPQSRQPIAAGWA